MEIKNSVITVIRHKDRKVVANNVLTVIKSYVGSETQTIKISVDNNSGIISGELTEAVGDKITSEIKRLSTKIVSTETENEIPENIINGDFILSKIKE